MKSQKFEKLAGPPKDGKGELVGVDSPDRILHQPSDPRIQAFLRTYHERNSI